MADLTDQLETEEVGEYLGNMVDDGGDSEEGRCSTVILKMPEEEGEDQAYAEAHEPRDEEKGSAFEILELLQHGHPFRDLSHRLGEHLGLERKFVKIPSRNGSLF